VATSAELDVAMVKELLAAGFVDALLKPASIDAIGEVVRRFVAANGAALASPPIAPFAEETLPLLDDAVALSAIGGDRTALDALRVLFVAELEAIERDIRGPDRPTVDTAVLVERLHRLRASCGFCGAPTLGACAARLQELLSSGADADTVFEEFLTLIQATMHALSAQA
jgi:HPt (histidine-containing phosphotransfer) domain-containing protein